MTPQPDISAYIAGLPKAELHVHMQGAASVETVLGLSQRYPEMGLPQDESGMRKFYRFTDFANFIAVYVAVAQLVRTADDVYDLALGLGRDLAAVNVRYAEATVTADSHLAVGIEPDALSDALTRGRADAMTLHGVELGWVFDIDGEFGLASGERLLSWCSSFLPEGSVGFGIGGPEADVPRSEFAGIFHRAKDLGLHSVPHAGETVGPNEIWSSIDLLGAERIGHGISAVQDPSLMEALAERGITLEVCPTSNICTGAVANLDAHPFPVLRDAGVRLTMNTDDPGMFSTDLNREYAIAHESFGLDASALTELARESVRASFAAEATKAAVLAEIDGFAATRVVH
jgi:aminodeoxyfutalosine deaminase